MDGQADPPLSPDGLREAAHLAAQLPPLGIGRVVSSDLRRAAQTADAAATALGTGPATRDPRLREHAIPAWEGLTPRADRGGLSRACWPRGGNAGGSLPCPARSRGTTWSGGCWTRSPTRGVGGGGVTLVVAHAGVLRALHTALAGEAVKLGRWKGRWIEVHGDAMTLGGGVERFERPG